MPPVCGRITVALTLIWSAWLVVLKDGEQFHRDGLYIEQRSELFCCDQEKRREYIWTPHMLRIACKFPSPISPPLQYRKKIDIRRSYKVRRHTPPHLTVVMDSKAWLAVLFISLVAAAFSASTALVCCLYTLAVTAVATITPPGWGQGATRAQRAPRRLPQPVL